MDQIKIGSFLKELRKERNLSQEQLAEKFNISSRSVSRWENGNTMPDISMMIELADFYDIDIRELLRGSLVDIDQCDFCAAERKRFTESGAEKRCAWLGLGG